ncbi:hypothetical protein TRVA0_023S00936 [Trichomonascus vanleenenianus]|uniref:Rfu1p n=1 Tax=Trichomonascus vanleenenianus TaxID=2268995 RepID=UPI003EC9C01F
MIRPRSSQELVEEANSYEFSHHVSFRSWLHVAKTVLNEAVIYQQENAHSEAFLLYNRFANLLLNSLPKHPDFKGSNAKNVRKLLEDNIEFVFKQLERLKSIIDQEVESYKLLQEQNRRKREQSELRERQIQETVQNQAVDKDYGDQDLEDEIDMSFMETLSSLKRLKAPIKEGIYKTGKVDKNNVSKIQYPSAEFSTSVAPPQLNNVPKPPIPPRMPYNQPMYQSAGELGIVAAPKSASAVSVPIPPPKTLAREAIAVEHKSRNFTEGNAPLRTIFLPTSLRESFMELASPNTNRNLETCGILCGSLNRNAFFVTHLVIPHQESTSDTCTTTNEELLFEFVDEKKLFILGWIHTHPSQTCFLSSIDLHTQSSYQIMLPEAVAIVCAPKHNPSWGIFRLTDPPGIDVLKECRQPQGFHPHPEPNLYTGAYKPGHVKINSEIPFRVEDLRMIKPKVEEEKKEDEKN